VNLRTFLPPPDQEIAEPPSRGRPAPGLEGHDAPGCPQIVAFLRHTGCPFAERTFRELRDRATEHPEVCFLAVSHSPEAATDAWAEAVGGRGEVDLVVDEERSLYAAWGLGRSSFGHFMGLTSLRAVGELAREGVRNRHPHGTRWQQAGTFALDPDQTVCWRHLPEHAGDLPDLRAAIRACRPSG